MKRANLNICGLQMYSSDWAVVPRLDLYKVQFALSIETQWLIYMCKVDEKIDATLVCV